MIICLSGFVIAGTSPTRTSMPFSSRNDISAMERVSVGVGIVGRYSPHHQQLLHQLGGGGGGGGGSSSSAESVSSSSPPPAGPGPGARSRRVRTLYACLGESEGELSFEPNQVITNVAPSGEPGWLHGDLDGRRGLVPENYVEPLP